MPYIWLETDELRALRAIFTGADRVDWEAYDRARSLIATWTPEDSTEGEAADGTL